MKLILGERTLVVLWSIERLELEGSKRGSSRTDDSFRDLPQGQGVYQESKRWDETQIVSRDSSHWKFKSKFGYIRI